MEKVSLYKFTHIPLLKNDAQFKQKVISNTKKKKKKKEKKKHHTQEIKRKKIYKNNK